MKTHLFIFRIVLSVVIYVAAMPMQAFGFAGGTGEPNDPYQIATQVHLLSIGLDRNLLDKHYVLNNDIVLNGVFDRPIIAGDINGDCHVNFLDVTILMNHWLEQGHQTWPEPSDINSPDR